MHVQPDFFVRDRYLTNAFSVIAFFVFLIFGSAHWVLYGHGGIGFFYVACASVVGVNALVLHYTKKGVRAQYILSAIVLVASVLQLITGGIEYTGIFWLFIFPASIFFLMGTRKGVLWMVLFYGALFATLFLQVIYAIPIPYNEVTLRQLFFSLFVVAIISFLVERNREEKERAITDLAKFPSENPYPVLRISHQGIVLYANKAASPLLGDWKCTVGHKLPVKWRKIITQIYTKMKSDVIEVERTHQVLSFVVAPVESGKYVNLYGRDVTHEKEIDRVKTEFVSLASHQLRTPLSIIKWYTEMIQDKELGEVSTKQKAYLKRVYTANDRMIQLVNALLNVSRIELGTFAVEPVSLDIVKAARDVLRELEPFAKRKRITIQKQFDTRVKILRVDPNLIHIILHNLLSNALKYTQKGGTVQLGITHPFTITVSDTGIGISKKDQKKIFTKLFRTDNARSMDTEGTGLGLYMVKSIVDQTGGAIRFTSTINKGTTFYVTLPRKGMRKKKGTKKLE